MDQVSRRRDALPMLVGRPLIALLFVHSGRRVFADPTGPTAKLRDFAGSRPLAPSSARLLVRLNAAIMVIAGGALGFGVAPRAAAWVLLLALQPTNVVGHDFWARSDPNDRSKELGAFITNLAVTGGLVTAASRTRRRTP